jgi:hypothetical protein
VLWRADIEMMIDPECEVLDILAAKQRDKTTDDTRFPRASDTGQ